MKTLDTERIKKDFPILSRTVRAGKRLVYLDNAATTQKPRCVIEAISGYYSVHNANVHRGFHQLAEESTDILEKARAKTAAFINAGSAEEVVFTRGATESINLAAFSCGKMILKPGDQIMLTVMEHHSNLLPWQQIARETGAELCFIPGREDGELDWPVFQQLLSPKVKILAMTHMSNVLGTINPVKKYVDAAHEAGAKVLIDAAQSLPHFRVDVRDMDCDFLAFSGHKMLGPMGIGVLYAKRSLLDMMPPYQTGGSMIHRVALRDAVWADVPLKFEAGTPNVAGAAGLAAAIDYLEALGMENIFRHEQELTRYLLARLEAIRGVQVVGRARERGGLIAWHMDHVHPHDMAQFADQEGVAIRAGHHCAQPLVVRYGFSSLSRASLYLYNDRADADALAEVVDKTARFFHGI